MFTEIKLSTISKSVFNQISKREIKLLQTATISFVAKTKIYNQLITFENYPINKKLAIINILEFLQYLDLLIADAYGQKVEIPKIVFENYFTPQHYVAYQDILKKLNIITVTTHPDGTYYTFHYLSKADKEAGKKIDYENLPPAKCKIYFVQNEYLEIGSLSLIIPQQKKTTRKIENKIKDLDKRYINTIKKVEINTIPAIESEIAEYKIGKIQFTQLVCRLHRIFQLNKDRKINFGPNVKRIYHTLSNISRVSREHFSIPFHHLDVKNCQPLLLCALMVRDVYNFDDNYKNDCENAEFYERFYKNPGEKDATKVLLYRHVFFGFKPHEQINKKFKVLYPKTWVYLYEISKSDISLASKLQNQESELFNYLIPQKSRHFFTLFDAIYFDKKEDSDKLEQEIHYFFGELGLKVKVDNGEK